MSHTEPEPGVFALTPLGQTLTSSQPVQLGAWAWKLAGFVALCLVFPDGLAPGRRWRIGPEPAQRLVAVSGAEAGQPQPGQPIQIGDAVHRGNPAAGDCDRDERHRPFPDGDQHPRYAVDYHRGEVG